MAAMRRVLYVGGLAEEVDGKDYETGDKLSLITCLVSHALIGLLSMANSRPNANDWQFFITVDNTDWLDDKHVVWRTQGSKDGKTKQKVIISNCGEFV